MSSLNKVNLIGRLGQDPDVRYGNSGSAITTVSIATSERWTDKATGQKQERTEWHRVVFFGRLAEIAGQYLKKGSLVYIEGSLRTNKYTDKQGVERYSTDINANELKMLGGGDLAPNQGLQQPTQQQGRPQQLPQQKGNSFDGHNDFDSFDDTVPF